MGASQVSAPDSRPRVRCSEDGCPASVANNRWAKIHSVGWFFMRDGSAYCPEHLPEWLAEWRAGRSTSE